jgi:hypothetical protein
MPLKLINLHRKHLRLEIILTLPWRKHEILIQNLPINQEQVRKTLLTDMPSGKTNKRLDNIINELLNKIIKIEKFIRNGLTTDKIFYIRKNCYN